jgi:hypothetical protein
MELLKYTEIDLDDILWEWFEPDPMDKDIRSSIRGLLESACASDDLPCRYVVKYKRDFITNQALPYQAPRITLENLAVFLISRKVLPPVNSTLVINRLSKLDDYKPCLIQTAKESEPDKYAAYIASYIPIQERAAMRKGLPAALKISEVAELAYPDNKIRQETTVNNIKKLCQDGLLECYGDINGWKYREDMPNPYPKVKGDHRMGFSLDSGPITLYTGAGDCLIHLNDLKPLQEAIFEWDVDGVFTRWLSQDQAQNNTPTAKQSPPLENKGVDDTTTIDINHPATSVEQSNPPQSPSQDEKLAALFDPVTVETLEKMFPANGKWVKWAERAARNELNTARQDRAMYNPYKAGLWFLRRRVKDWDLARCHRVLAKNLPARSRDEVHLLTDEIP